MKLSTFPPFQLIYKNGIQTIGGGSGIYRIHSIKLEIECSRGEELKITPLKI